MKKMEIISSSLQTKEWRKNQSWYRNGKITECEKYQVEILEKIIKMNWNKTYDRINFESFEIKDKKNIGEKDGFEWSETFDGKFLENKNTLYFNLKFVCDQGGAQTRSLREVYLFIKYQFKYLLKNKTNNIYFYNILDGDESFKHMNKFRYLQNKEKYKDIKKYIFIGSLYRFSNTYKN